jgi:hypothetical protein
VDLGAGVNIRELIEQLTEVAEALPAGLDTAVEVHLCNGDDAEGVLTRVVTVDHVDTFAVVRGHPHLDEENTVVRPLTMDVDNELARIVSGEQVVVRPAVLVEIGDGTSIRVPVDEGTPMLPGSPGALAEGCICSPVLNRGALRAAEIPSDRRSPGALVELSFDAECPFHTRVLPALENP